VDRSCCSTNWDDDNRIQKQGGGPIR
jgi:hypothetical protein